MNQSANDPDGLVQRQNNPNHSTMMSKSKLVGNISAVDKKLEFRR
jgi:hypothetical protein